jgi:hypothetical protein
MDYLLKTIESATLAATLLLLPQALVAQEITSDDPALPAPLLIRQPTTRV